MKINLRQKEGVTIFDLEGNIDINASNFVETVGRELVRRAKKIICNFTAVNSVDYVGISIIAVAYKNILNHKGMMKVYGIPSHIKNLFSLVGMDRVLEAYKTEGEALASFKEDKVISQILKKQLRRRFKRIPLKGVIRYRQKFSRRETFYRGKFLNLSALGVFVFAEKIFPLGEILSVRIYLLPKPNVIEADAKVVWVVDREVQPQLYPGMGIEFYKITAEKQEQIVEFVEKHLTHTTRE